MTNAPVQDAPAANDKAPFPISALISAFAPPLPLCSGSYGNLEHTAALIGK